MTKPKKKPQIQMIAIEKINVLNPRVRSQKVFKSIADNITMVGLKRPITVKKGSVCQGKEYDLVCGQGRMEAFIACGEKKIPAIVIDASEEEALMMSLVENLARRHHRSLDLLQALEVMQKQGYDAKAIAEKTGMTVEYIHAVLNLLEKGEERLLQAVESGQIPISVATSIANTPFEDVQHALQDAYENKLLRGQKLLVAKRLVEIRKQRGKAIRGAGTGQRRGGPPGGVSASAIVKAYQKEADRKHLLVRKANFVQERLTFIVQALSEIYRDQEFQKILKAQGLTTLPKQLSNLMKHSK